MGIDPISGLLALLLVGALLKRAPGLIQDAVDAWRDGAWSRAYREQVARMRKAGQAPSRSGGAVRRFLANAWREASAAQSARWAAASAASSGGGRRGLAGALDRAAQRRAARTAARDAQAARAQRPVRASATVGPRGGDTASAGGAGGGAASSMPTIPVMPMPMPGQASPARSAPPTGGPTRVNATVGTPQGGGTATAVLTPAPALPAATAPRQIEGGTPMSAGAVEVSGVTAGAGEAGRIAAEAEAATEEFRARLARLRARINALAEGTVGLIEMRGDGEVMTTMAAAAESLAAAERAAGTCAADVGPWMRLVQRAFVKRI